MAAYRVQLYEADGSLTKAVDLDAQDDGAAIDEMGLYAWGWEAGPIELWDGRRLVMVAYHTPLPEVRRRSQQHRTLN